jgi:hypothetical protein
MSSHRRTKLQRENDYARIAELHAQGLSQREIAEQIGVSQVQICKDLKEIYRRWREPDKTKLPIVKARLLAEIAANKKAMRQAWRDSLKPKEVTSQKQVSVTGEAKEGADGEVASGDRERKEASLRTEDRDGNVAYMREIREYIALECKMHGLFAPEQVQHSGGDAPIRIIEIIRPSPGPSESLPHGPSSAPMTAPDDTTRPPTHPPPGEDIIPNEPCPIPPGGLRFEEA